MDEKSPQGLENFIPQLKELIRAESVFGEPYNVGEVTLIPINSVRVGFGFGKGGLFRDNPKGQETGGGGVMLTPVAFVVIRKGEFSIHSLNTGTLENIMEKAPELIERLASSIKKFQQKPKSTDDS